MSLRSFLKWSALPVFSSLEIGATILLTKEIGMVRTYQLFVVTLAVGLLMQGLSWWRLKKSAKISLNEVFDRNKGLKGKKYQAAVVNDPDYYEAFDNTTRYARWWASFILLFVPGFFTHVLAFLVMFVPIKTIYSLMGTGFNDFYRPRAQSK